jgi:hypothetical protein
MNHSENEPMEGPLASEESNVQEERRVASEPTDASPLDSGSIVEVRGLGTEPLTEIPGIIQHPESELSNEEPSELVEALMAEAEEAILPDYSAMDLEALLTHLGDSVKKSDLSEEHRKIQAIKSQVDHWFQKLKAQQELELLEGESSQDHVPVSQSPLFLLYQDLWQRYQAKRQHEKQEKEAKLQANLALKEALLDELHRVVDEEEQGKTGVNEQLKSIQQRWKDCGPVPPEQRQALWNRYHLLHDKFYNNLRINRELKELDLARNLDTKIQLCEQAEQLLLENDILKAGSRLTLLHEQWKATGPVPRPQSESVWERFKNASDRIFQNRRGKFEELESLRAENFRLKTQLCENLEILVRALPEEKPNWSQLTQTVELLQQDWRQTGPVPKEQQEPLWKRFKGALDQFYGARLQHYKAAKAAIQELVQQRELWCKEAESWSQSTDWKAGTQALTALQKNWKEAPALPRKFSDKYWNRFRKACDTFFQAKNTFFSDEKSKQAENLEHKKALVERLNTYTGSGDSSQDMAFLMEIQRSWNEIGFVPMAHKESLQKQFRELTNKWFDQLKIDRESHREAQYQTRLQQMSSHPAGDRELSKEQTQLQYKINDLRKEMDLLENNLGFFSRSKNADLMRQEVEKKIEVIKSQIIQLEAKLRLVRQSRQGDKDKTQDPKALKAKG